MNDLDLITICMAGIEYLSDRERVFVLSTKARLLAAKTLSLPQNNYLQACYDKVITKKYNIEPVNKPHNYFKRKRKKEEV